jgi:hypothetical protein
LGKPTGMHLVRTEFKTDNQEITWWDSHNYTGERTANAMLRDAQKAMLRKHIRRAVLDQHHVRTKINTYDQAITLCSVLNGIAESVRMLHIVMEDGRIIEYSRRSDWDSAEKQTITLGKVDLPTMEYAEWYQWLLDNPAMHHLAMVSPSLRNWREVLRRSGVKMSQHVSLWLYKTVQQKGHAT